MSNVPLIACHEAGHAVVAFHLGTCGVIELRLTPGDADRGGVCRYGTVPAGDPRHEILLSCAGHAAEAVLLGREPTRRSARDDQRAFEVALSVAGSIPAANALVMALRVQAREILSRADRWVAVVAIAEALHQRGKLTGAEAHRIALAALG